ncbi:MAG TPA: hypothetical protein VJ761_06405, partial [Ktedonobacteraceae bacterium]|nr:hypothetical protein [Ktedonobacteraceae bacterium]
MRFSLQDVKKQVQRRGGELYVSLHFLRPAELHADIERLVAFHERHIGVQHRQFSIDEARTMIADYRLANCLLATLSAWYTWQQPDWQETVSCLGNGIFSRLEEAGITSPIYLRLALFNYINEHYSGFLDAQQRSEVLQAFASPYGLSIPDLEYFLALDNESEAVLARETPHPPSVQEVAALYNQWAFEAALFNASDVHFAIDCQAFIRAQKAEEPSHTPAAGIGSVIKRLCFLARKLGVYYDLAYDTERGGRPQGIAPTDDTGGRPQGIAPTDDTERIHLSENNAAILHLTLYGPQEMTGAPQQYGLRLARLCRMILGYGSARPAGANHRSRPGLIGAVREAEATVHFLQRAYHFAMNSDLLKLLPSDTIPPNPVGADLSRPSPIHRPSVEDHPLPDVLNKNHSRPSSIF